MDQHFPGPVTRALARRGMDVLTAQDAGRCGLPDPDQLAFATAEERVVVTFDSDYVALHNSGVQHAGMVWCPERKYSTREMIQWLTLIHGVLTRDEMRNRLEYL